jgi:hypothetical protein
MIITSVVLLAGAFVLLVVGALQGNPQLLGISLGAAGAGALALFAGNASARRIAVARGVPLESVLAARLRRVPAGQGAPNGTGDTTDKNHQSERPAEATPAETTTPPPIDGYDDMSARDVTRLVASGVMADDDLSAMLVYEASHRRRRGVLTALLDVVGPKPARSPQPDPAVKDSI